MDVSRLDFAVELWRLKFVISAGLSKVFEWSEWRIFTEILSFFFKL